REALSRLSRGRIDTDSDTQADKMAGSRASSPLLSLSPERLNEIAEDMLRDIDPEEGGFGAPPKFPHVPNLFFLWQAGQRTGWSDYENAVLLTLRKMSQGGIYDHLGGGFS